VIKYLGANFKLELIKLWSMSLINLILWQMKDLNHHVINNV